MPIIKYTLTINFKHDPDYYDDQHPREVSESFDAHPYMSKPGSDDEVPCILRDYGLRELTHKMFCLRSKVSELESELKSYKLKVSILRKEVGDDLADKLILPEGMETTPESLEFHAREYIRLTEPMKTMKQEKIEEMERQWAANEALSGKFDHLKGKLSEASKMRGL